MADLKNAGLSLKKVINAKGVMCHIPAAVSMEHDRCPPDAVVAEFPGAGFAILTRFSWRTSLRFSCWAD